MIKRLKISHFKSIRELEIDCKRINILIGRPNSGKSNLLESLAIFAFNYAEDLHKLVRFEIMPELFYNQELEKPIRVTANGIAYELQIQKERFPAIENFLLTI